ncbi:hypothetical protein LH464_19140 [Neorhizobium sp. T786]|uniref:hypothetical protein n=1 Tax=Pseudorhizobium xiangyangii TaxID=2883104 RepID=UPI001CFF986F|nr:hypothetical protein [Neorhizobium xiangyangii]MCB5204586.1 hypothetical protein [Neorhizobium xiangyangii]
MPMVILHKVVNALERYFALVRRCNDFHLHRFDAEMLRRVRRDFGLDEQPVSVTTAGGAHAALRPANGATGRLGGPTRLHRAGGRA